MANTPSSTGFGIPGSDARLSHLDESGSVRMVDISHKNLSARSATAYGRVRLGEHAFALLSAQDNAKGEVLTTAHIAGIQAAKRCAELIPLCHSLPLAVVTIEFTIDAPNSSVIIHATCKTTHGTGVEMEAMTACSVAALTIYDMCKAADKGIVIETLRLLHKSGGKSGEWHATEESAND